MSETNGRATMKEVGKVYSLPVNRIRRFELQPRKYFDEPSLQALGKSLKRRQRVIIKVVEIKGDPLHDYEIDDGERRWRAAKLMGITHLDAQILSFHTVRDQYVDSTISNLHRADHTPQEKTDAFLELKQTMTVEEIADETGFSTGSIYNYMSLQLLVPEVRALMDPRRPKDKQLLLIQALRLIQLSPELQREVAQEIVDKKVPANQTRFLVQTRSHEAGKSIKSDRPNRDYEIVTGFVDRLKDQANLILNMPDPIFVAMFASRTDEEVNILSSQINASIGHLQQLLTKVKHAKEASNVKKEVTAQV
jgi:ParB/RepB/Spo0J family partition protein